MISHLEANELLDQYASLLTSRQKEILELYFQDDLSLSEIQENLGISRAAVHDALHKGIASMEHFEKTLHLVRMTRMLQEFVHRHPEFQDELTLHEDNTDF